MRGIFGIDPGWGVTIVRIVVGVILLVAGFQAWAVGTTAITTAFTKMQIPLPHVAGPFVKTLEVVGGVGLILGVWARWFGLLFAAEFVVAAFYVKWAGVGFANARLDLCILAASLLVFIAGPGRAAIDSLWLERPAPAEPVRATDRVIRRRSA